jgi:hypothetical protein
MEAKDVPAVLKVANPNYEINVGRVCADAATCDPTKGPPIRITAMDPKTGETLEISLTPPPSPGFVMAVSRKLSFPPGSQPTVATLVDSLKKKYGPETAGPDTVYTPDRRIAYTTRPFSNAGGGVAVSHERLAWMFDPQGQLIKWTTDNGKSLMDCGAGDDTAALPAERGAVLETFYRTGGLRGRAWALCSAANVGAGVGATNGLVIGLQVAMVSQMLYESGMTSTWKWLDQLAKERLEKERQQGQKIAAPKL